MLKIAAVIVSLAVPAAAVPPLRYSRGFTCEAPAVACRPESTYNQRFGAACKIAAAGPHGGAYVWTYCDAAGTPILDVLIVGGCVKLAKVL